MKVTLSIVVVLLATAWGSPAFAQDPVGVSSELERTASTTPEEKIAFAASANAEIREAVKAIAKLVEEARREANTTAYQCLTTRQTALRALSQVSETAEGSLQMALASKQVEKADHEYRKIAVALGKGRILRAEAEGCLSEGELQSGQTMVDWNSDGDFSDQDETSERPNDDELEIGMDPPDVSPFL